jgi:hypothetical protein
LDVRVELRTGFLWVSGEFPEIRESYMQLELQRTGHARRVAIASIAVAAALIIAVGVLLLDAFYPGGVRGYLREAGAVLDNATASGAGF